MTTFFALLCCPKCRGDLDRLEADALRCAACDFDFPIVDGIPVLFPCNVKTEMPELFRRYWDSESKADLYDTQVEGGENIFGRYNHESELYGITTHYDTDKLNIVLDAGCGNGRFFETLPPKSSKVGLDASLALLRRTKARGRGDFLVCGELEHLPFKDGLFTTVISCRVLQHLRQQSKAVVEMARVTREGGDVILQLYNTWNLKTLYKNIRMSPKLSRLLNAPFRLFFRSMCPFAPWGLDYDQYNGWFQVKRWMCQSGLHEIRGRGIGFGYHKYFFDPFYITVILSRRTPKLYQWYLRTCLSLEKLLGGVRPFSYAMEKFVIKGTKTSPTINRSLYRRVVAKAVRAYKSSEFYNPTAVRERTREASLRFPCILDARTHLLEAIEWLKRAQDATPDRGVARGFGVGWIPNFQSQGWQPSYPETTGYIIPTVFDCAAVFNQVELRHRAVQMADWEIQIQLPTGAVMGGTVDRPPTPAVFNTGQVMLGWLRAWHETGDQKYAEATERAARFLVATQGEDGSWRNGNSLYALQSSTTYNARVGWALILYGKAIRSNEYLKAGVSNLAYTLSQQRENGWFLNNCLSDPSAPLTHTICYALEGLLGGYEVLGDERYLQAVKVVIEHISRCIDEHGFLAGRFDASWRSTVLWSCLAGSAQLTCVLFKLHTITHDPKYFDLAMKVLNFVKSTQNCESTNLGIRGGIKGSYPFDGDYGRYEILNWATKFFIDALLLECKLSDAVSLA